MRLYVGIIATAVTLLVGSEIAVRMFDTATPDERAILDSFALRVADQNCLPGRTSAVGENFRDRRWVEADDREAARIDAAARRAVTRNARVGTDRGWMLPVITSLIASTRCSHPIRVSTPAFSGEYAFVTAATDEGVSISAFRRGPNGWACGHHARGGLMRVECRSEHRHSPPVRRMMALSSHRRLRAPLVESFISAARK